MGRGKAQRTLALLDAAHEILAEIQPASVRAVCYRLFTRGLIGSMHKTETNRVSTQLTWAREQCLIPWGWIVDETREAERVSAWENPAAYVDTVSRAYRRDRWKEQPHWIEVWSEKGTVRGTLAPVLHEYGVTFRVMHGYGSATAIHQVAAETAAAERLLTVLYVGDFDPSGLHMSEVDLPSRLQAYGGHVCVERLALTEADTRTGLPSFAAESKRHDPRHRWYVRLWLQRQPEWIDNVTNKRAARALLQRAANIQCWELDALSPVILRQRVEQAIAERLDRDAWDRAERTEAAECESLRSILATWPTISRQASNYAAREG